MAALPLLAPLLLLFACVPAFHAPTLPDDPDHDFDGDGHTERDGDCEDEVADIFPDALERCDGVDNDCDGAVDGYDPSLDGHTFYLDADRDTFGTEYVAIVACAQPAGYATNGGDCDDDDPTSHPSAPEVCGDGVDQDCDGSVQCEFTADDGALAVLVGAQDEDYAGTALAGAGDLDRDGLDDVLLGAPGYEDRFRELGDDRGGVFVFQGPLTGALEPSNADAVVVGRDAGSELGRAVAAPGDVDGDGLRDVLLGAPGEATDTTIPGSVYILSGPVEGEIELELLPGVAGVTELLGQPGEKVGTAVVGAGDVDQDGLPDLVVGDPSADGDTGVAWLLLGPPAEATAFVRDVGLALVGEQPNDWAGRALAAGDVDDDGVSDVVVASRRHPFDYVEQGAVYVVSGDRDWSGVGTLSLEDADLKMVGATANEALGSSMAVVPDVDGDGAVDLLLGAERRTDDLSQQGAVYVVYGGASLAACPGVPDTVAACAAATVFGSEAQGNAGYAVDGLDLDRDGVPDLVVGARPTSAESSGAAYVKLAPVAGTVRLDAAELLLQGQRSGDNLGAVVAGAGNVNGDGATFLVGAPNHDSTDGRNSQEGAAYLWSLE